MGFPFDQRERFAEGSERSCVPGAPDVLGRGNRAPWRVPRTRAASAGWRENRRAVPGVLRNRCED